MWNMSEIRQGARDVIIISLFAPCTSNVGEMSQSPVLHLGRCSTISGDGREM